MTITDAEWQRVYSLALPHALAWVREAVQDGTPLREIDPGVVGSDVFDLTLPDVDDTDLSYLEACDVSDVAYECARIVLDNAIITRERNDA